MHLKQAKNSQKRAYFSFKSIETGLYTSFIFVSLRKFFREGTGMTATTNKRFNELKQYVQTDIEREVTAFWESDNTFKKSIASREGKPSYVFYEGPPSANGLPGIHHVMARAIKDIFCRFKTIKGFKVERKGGWDTHGLPIELQVEKTLGITKKDIGTKISVEDYNKECRKEVMRFKDKWDELTKIMGYWVDLDDPYITYENEYIESTVVQTHIN